MYPLAIVLPTFSRGKVLKRSAELYWPSILAENGARFFFSLRSFSSSLALSNSGRTVLLRGVWRAGNFTKKGKITNKKNQINRTAHNTTPSGLFYNFSAPFGHSSLYLNLWCTEHSISLSSSRTDPGSDCIDLYTSLITALNALRRSIHEEKLSRDANSFFFFFTTDRYLFSSPKSI